MIYPVRPFYLPVELNDILICIGLLGFILIASLGVKFALHKRAKKEKKAEKELI